MLTKTEIKWIRSLSQKKFREKEGCFIVEGPRLVNELLASGDFLIRRIYCTSGWNPPVQSRNLPISMIDEESLSRISGLESPNKVIAVVELPVGSKGLLSVPPPGEGVYLLLDQIQDPGNLGTIIRIADWFGISGVFCSLNTVELFNPKVIQSTMGSIFRVPVIYTSLADLLVKNATGSRRPVYATTLSGDDVFKAELSSSAFMIMGNEGRGIDPLLMPFVSKELFIPGKSVNSTGAESLNVAVATGIICAELTRRQLLKN